MPKTGGWAAYFVDNEGSPIDSRDGLDRNTGGSSPGIGCGGHAHSRSNSREGKSCRPGDVETAIGDIVIHVALPGMRLAPGILLRSVILRLGIIGCARI